MCSHRRHGISALLKFVQRHFRAAPFSVTRVVATHPSGSTLARIDPSEVTGRTNGLLRIDISELVAQSGVSFVQPEIWGDPDG